MPLVNGCLSAIAAGPLFATTIPTTPTAALGNPKNVTELRADWV